MENVCSCDHKSPPLIACFTYILYRHIKGGIHKILLILRVPTMYK